MLKRLWRLCWTNSKVLILPSSPGSISSSLLLLCPGLLASISVDSFLKYFQHFYDFSLFLSPSKGCSLFLTLLEDLQSHISTLSLWFVCGHFRTGTHSSSSTVTVTFSTFPYFPDSADGEQFTIYSRFCAGICGWNENALGYSFYGNRFTMLVLLLLNTFLSMIPSQQYEIKSQNSDYYVTLRICGWHTNSKRQGGV